MRIYEISGRLAKKGHEIHIYTMNWWNGNDFVKDGIYYHGVCKPKKLYTPDGRRSISQALYFGSKVLFPLLKEDFDLIDADHMPYFPCFSTKIASVVKGTPLVITWLEVWDKYWYDYLGLFKGLAGRLIERIVTKFPDEFITISNATKKGLTTIGVNESRVEFIPIGININKIKRIKPSNKRYDALFAGRLIKDKNVDVLIKSIKLVKKNIPLVSCCIIGDGPEKENLIKLVEDFNLKENIKFIGFLGNADIISHMKSSKIFVLPSTREGFGLVILEANACGSPVVGVNSENSRCVGELIKNGENGILLDKLDERVLAHKISLLLRDDELRRKMSEKGKEISMGYDWDNLINRIEKIYLRMLKK